MVAALRNEPNMRLKRRTAAVAVQRAHRGRMAREQIRGLQTERSAATKIQSRMRGRTERAEAEHKLAEAERVLAAERAELSALRGYARADRRNALKKRPVAGLSEPQREFLSREARRECLRRSAMLVKTLALVALVVYLISIANAPCEDGAHLDGWDRDGCGHESRG